MIRGFLGLDIGGTGVKAALYDGSGTLLGLGRRSLEPIRHPDGRVEIEIGTIEEAARGAVREALRGQAVMPAALAIVSQGQTFVSLDGKGRPLHPAILWYDSRATKEAEALNRRLEEEPTPAPRFSAISTGSKIRWWFQRDPERMAAARRFLLLPDYFTWCWTGRAVTDPHTAGSTGLTDGGLTYHPAALSAVGLRPEQLAEIQPPGSVVGPLRPDVAESWGLPAGLPVVIGTNDQYAGALGAGVAGEGLLSVATGTCLAAVTLVRGNPPPLPPGLFVGEFPLPGFSFVLAYAKTAGIALEWFRREFAAGLSLSDLDGEAAASPPGSRGITVIPHFDGKVSPTPRPEERGRFAGLGLHHQRADLYRALLEALAFCLRENLEALMVAGLGVAAIRAHGGGAASPFWLQMLADVTELPVERGQVTEAATLEAAMLAAAGSGEFATIEEAVQRMYRTVQRFEPRAEMAASYREAYARYARLSAISE